MISDFCGMLKRNVPRIEKKRKSNSLPNKNNGRRLCVSSRSLDKRETSISASQFYCNRLK